MPLCSGSERASSSVDDRPLAVVQLQVILRIVPARALDEVEAQLLPKHLAVAQDLDRLLPDRRGRGRPWTCRITMV